MKKTIKALRAVVGLLLLLLIGLALFLNGLKPDYNGKKYLPGLENQVEVFFDTYGVPHIYAQSETDGLRALGYVHAQDRLWQMELLRRVAQGRLAEIFGPELVPTDKFFLSLGIDDYSKRTVAQMDPKSQTTLLSQAYLEGINNFMEMGPTPVEFLLIGIEKEPFTLRDIQNAVGYMAFSFAMAHKTDPLLTSLRDKLGEAYMKELAVASDSGTVWIKNHKEIGPNPTASKIPAQVQAVLEKLPIPMFEGSNAWVIGPNKTKNGKVILANDPHIGFAQPSTWYEAHLVTPNYEKYGYHLAAVPFPLLGHDRNLAYGLTMFENDDIDFYQERTNPADSTQYLGPQGWKNYEYVERTIKVKGGEDVSFVYRKTDHGPVMDGISGDFPKERPIAMSWLYTKVESQIMDALYGVTHATGLREFKEALPKIHAPGLNFMYGDARGNVAWWAAAKLYQMPDSLSTKYILEGSSGKEEPLRYLDFSENPSAVNPPWDYVYSANNQPDSIAGMLVPGYYLPENRAKRIVELLEAKDDWDVESTSRMILDVTSTVNTDLVRELIKLFDVTQMSQEQLIMIDSLENWQGDYPLKSVSATLFHRCEYYFAKNTMEDEMGPELFQQFLATHTFKRQIAHGAMSEKGLWWDNVHTEKVETRRDMVNQSFQDAWESLVMDLGPDPKAWTWDRLHTLEHKHPMGQVKFLKKYFNVGPFPAVGSREVINNMSFPYDSTGRYRVSSGPSTRRIIDFSDLGNSLGILPTGQSGNPLSKHYRDQAEMYNRGAFRKLMMDRKEIEENAASILRFIND